MPFIEDDIYDNGLSQIASATARRVDICQTAEPTTYTEATSTNTVGNETGLTISAIANGDVDGRKVTIPAITTGSVTATATAGWWALTDASSVLHAAGALASTQSVTSGNTFEMTATDITIRDAA